MISIELKLSEYITRNYYTGKLVLDWEFFAQKGNFNIWKYSLFDDLTIDLRGIDFFSNDGIIWLLSFFYYRNLNQLSTTIKLPEEEETYDFLLSAGINRTNTLKLTLQNYQGITNQELSKDIALISNSKPYTTTNDFIDEAIHYIADELNIILNKFETKNLSISLPKFITEISTNMITHGNPFINDKRLMNVPICGFISLSRTYGKFPWIRICFSDLGPGFKHTLLQKENQSFYLNGCKTDEDAIITALFYRFFEIDSRILGLYNILGFVRENSGTIGIKNGNTLLLINLAEKKCQKIFDRNYDISSDYEWLRSIITPYVGEKVIGTHMYINLLDR